MENSNQIKITPLGKSYWNNSGAYQTEYSKLYNELVPDSGEAKTLHGELIRSISRLFHEYCNNGNGNARNVETTEEECTCSSCGGSGECGDEECDSCYGSGVETEEVESDAEIDSFYFYFIDFIKNNVKGIENDLKCVEDIILNSEADFKEKNMSKYNMMCDKVMFFVLNSENKNL